MNLAVPINWKNMYKAIKGSNGCTAICGKRSRKQKILTDNGVIQKDKQVNESDPTDYSKCTPTNSKL
jgi:hypothetical protein